MTMNDDIRRNFHELIDRIEDEQALTSLYAAAALYLDQHPLLLDTTDPKHLDRMRVSLEQASRNEVISNEDMKQQVRQWLGK
jgi:hypothetical protein